MKTIRIFTLGIMLCALMPCVAAQSTNTPSVADTLSHVLTHARQGDAAAQNQLGVWYYQGKYVKQDFELAVYWWIEASKQDYAEAIAHLGDCYRMGQGVQADSSRAQQLYIRSVRSGYKSLLDTLDARATKGEVVSSLALAQCHRYGFGTKRNEQEAVRYYALAAKQGSVVGMREAGRLYISQQKPMEAEQMLTQAIVAGDDEAAYYFGKMYFDGKVVKKDDTKAVHYLLMAANGGIPAAQYEIGNAYYRGEGVTKNLERAFEWHNKAAQKGNWSASWSVACCYKNGEGVDVDYYQSLCWYMAAAANGYQNKLAKLMNGEDKGWENSPMMAYVKAMKLFSQKEYAQACTAFKAMRKMGVKDSRVMEEVCKLWSSDTKVASNGATALQKMAKDNDHAALEVAKLQLSGQYLTKDIAAAVATLSRLAQKGYLAAYSALGDLYYEGVGVEKNLDEAVRYYLMAQTTHSLTTTAAQRLALCYETGVSGLEKDAKHAAKLNKQATFDPLTTFFTAIKM